MHMWGKYLMTLVYTVGSMEEKLENKKRYGESLIGKKDGGAHDQNKKLRKEL